VRLPSCDNVFQWIRQRQCHVNRSSKDCIATLFLSIVNSFNCQLHLVVAFQRSHPNHVLLAVGCGKQGYGFAPVGKDPCGLQKLSWLPRSLVGKLGFSGLGPGERKVAEQLVEKPVGHERQRRPLNVLSLARTRAREIGRRRWTLFFFLPFFEF